MSARSALGRWESQKILNLTPKTKEYAALPQHIEVRLCLTANFGT